MKSIFIYIALILLIVLVVIFCGNLVGLGSDQIESAHPPLDVVLSEEGYEDLTQGNASIVNQHNFREVKKFQDEWRSYSAVELEALIAASADKESLARILIGSGESNIDFARAVKVGGAMTNWGQEYIRAINGLMKGENYRQSAIIFVNRLVEIDNLNGVSEVQLEMNMGEDRASVGRELVKQELSNGSFKSAIQRVRNMTTAYDQGEALVEISMRLGKLEDLATQQNVDEILEVAREAGIVEKVLNGLRMSSLTRVFVRSE
jgi:hypothetical protein